MIVTYDNKFVCFNTKLAFFETNGFNQTGLALVDPITSNFISPNMSGGEVKSNSQTVSFLMIPRKDISFVTYTWYAARNQKSTSGGNSGSTLDYIAEITNSSTHSYSNVLKYSNAVTEDATRGFIKRADTTLTGVTVHKFDDLLTSQINTIYRYTSKLEPVDGVDRQITLKAGHVYTLGLCVNRNSTHPYQWSFVAATTTNTDDSNNYFVGFDNSTPNSNWYESDEGKHTGIFPYIEFDGVQYTDFLLG